MTATPVPDPLEALSLDRLRTRTSIKWRAYPSDVLPLWVAEMDVELAPPIAERLCDVARSGDTGYAAGTGYAEAWAGFAERRWGWAELPVHRSALVPDVMLGVVEALRLVTRPGDPVVVNPPVYPPFYAFSEYADRAVLEAPLSSDGRLDLEALAHAISLAREAGESAAYLLCNPHNPTGTVHTADELRAVAELAGAHGVRVISDEIHAPLVLPGARFVPYLSVAGDGDAFALLSASKGWNLAGLKAAILLCGSGAVSDLRRLPEVVSHGPSHVAAMVHTAALDEGEPWLDALLAGLVRKRDLLEGLLQQHLPRVAWRRPDASYLAWLDCTRLAAARPTEDAPDGGRRGDVTTVAGPTRFFLEHAKVALSAGEAFGTGGAGHVRLNFATSTDVLVAAVRAMGDAEARAADGNTQT